MPTFVIIHLFISVKIALGTNVFKSITNSGSAWSMANARRFDYLNRVPAYIIYGGGERGLDKFNLPLVRDKNSTFA